MKTVFFRVLEADDKAAALLAAIHDPEAAQGKQRFEVNPASFASVPRSPFAYWVSEHMRRLFKELPAFEAEGRYARVTNPAGDDTRFFRVWWEPSPSASADRAVWVLLNKGGAFSPYYFDLHLVVRWDTLMRSYFGFLGTFHRPLIKLASDEYFFRPGLTWPRRTQSGLALRAMPAGCIFADKGPAAFVTNDDRQELLALLAIANAASFRALVEMQMAFGSFEVGVIQRTPIPNLVASDQRQLATLARRAWLLKRSLDTGNETSHAFALPALLQTEGDSLAERVAAWVKRVGTVEAELGNVQVEIDERCFDLYGIDDTDRQAITEDFGSASNTAGDEEESDPEVDAEDESDDAGAATVDVTSLAAELLSWFLGVAFGRFDVQLATGARSIPEEPEPFDPLPICSPGMLQNAQGLLLTRDSESRQKAEGSWHYPIEIPWDGILVDDPNHPLDIEKAVVGVQCSVFSGQCSVAGDRPELTDHRPLTADHFSADHRPPTTDHYAEACEILGVKTLRDYFRKPSGFFADHLKHYSKSRRQAPIYWPLSTASGSYTLWIYYHRLTDQTLYACVNDFVQPKLNDLEREIPRLRDEKRTKELQAAVALQGELEDFKQELLAWAPRWKPNLNDGVLITACPLWKLFRLPRWRKDLEACWKELEAGDYDWAHLAYSLWPERVREKCKKDRSIAIAHGLEEICEVPAPNAKSGKRGKRKNATEAEQLALDKSEIM
jgi:hypothetical protein